MNPELLRLLGLGGMGGGATGGVAAPAPVPTSPSFADMWKANGGTTGAGQPSLATTLDAAAAGTAQPPMPPSGQSAGMSFNPSVDPVASAAATLTAAGAKPPMPTAKSPTALPDRNGSPMLPMMGGSGSMGGYYNDTPDSSQPLTAAGVKTPQQKAMIAGGQALASGLQDIVAPQTEMPRPPSPVSPPGPTVRPNMDALTQLIMQSAQSKETDPRKAGLAAMLMRG